MDWERMVYAVIGILIAVIAYIRRGDMETIKDLKGKNVSLEERVRSLETFKAGTDANIANIFSAILEIKSMINTFMLRGDDKDKY